MNINHVDPLHTGAQANSTPVHLESVLDTVLLRRMIAEGYVLQNRHPDDSALRILCYGTRTQIEGKWNDVTKLTRGLIVRSNSDDFKDAEVVERPWAKFFTLSQMNGGWHLGDEENISSAEDSFSSLDFDAPADVYDKMDGSLGILYLDPKGLPAFATKGAFASEQAVMFTKLMRVNALMREATEELLRNRQVTSLFELIGPDNRIVLGYAKNDVALLGGVEKTSGVNIKPENFSPWMSRGLEVTEKMSAQSLAAALALPARDNREGVVVSIGGDKPMKIKIKQDDYTKLHRIVTMFSPRESRNLVMAMDASYADLLAFAQDEDLERFEPISKVLNIDGFSKGDETYEFIRSRREDYFKSILTPRAQAIAKAKEIVDSLDETWFTGENPRKRFATSVKTFDADEASLFPLYQARVTGTPVEELSASQELRRAVRNVKDKND